MLYVCRSQCWMYVGHSVGCLSVTVLDVCRSQCWMYVGHSVGCLSITVLDVCRSQCWISVGQCWMSVGHNVWMSVGHSVRCILRYAYTSSLRTFKLLLCHIWNRNLKNVYVIWFYHTITLRRWNSRKMSVEFKLESGTKYSMTQSDKWSFCCILM